MPQAAETALPVKKELTNTRLQKLSEKKAALEKLIAAELAKANGKARKEDTRLKVIVGAALLANAALNPETRGGIVEVLKKAVTAPRDREFLASKGWL
jgi:hypothetical protein